MTAYVLVIPCVVDVLVESEREIVKTTPEVSHAPMSSPENMKDACPRLSDAAQSSAQNNSDMSVTPLSHVEMWPYDGRRKRRATSANATTHRDARSVDDLLSSMT